MSKPPELVQIRPEDFKQDDRELANILAGILNNFILQITQLLNQSLTFNDNFNAEVKSLTLTGGESVTFKLNNVTTPTGVILLRYRNVTTPTEVLTIPVGTPQWSFDGRGNITVQSIPGLTAANKYSSILLVV